MERSIAKFPVKYWDNLKTKEELYEKFDNMDPGDKNLIFAGVCSHDSNNYADSDFEKVAGKLEAAVKTLRPVLQEIENNFSTNKKYDKEQVQQILKKINLDGNANIATLALLICEALDKSVEDSFINRIRTGNGVPEERAAHRAGKRYQAFKAEDAARLEAFKNTPEYALQEAELKFKQREKIEFPEE